MPEARVRQKTHKFGPNQHCSHPPARRASTRAAPRPLPGGSRRRELGGLGARMGGFSLGTCLSPPKIPIPIHVSHPHPCAAERAAAPPRVRRARCAWGSPKPSQKNAAHPPPGTKTHGDGGGGGAASTTASFKRGCFLGQTGRKWAGILQGGAKGTGRGDIPHGAHPGRSVCPQRPCVVALGRGAPPFFHLTPLWGFLRGEEDPCPGAWPLLPLPQHPADGAVYCSGPLAKQREERREGQKFPQTADSPGEPARSGTRCQRSCWLQAGLGNQP